MHLSILLLALLGLFCAAMGERLNSTLDIPYPIDTAPPLDTGGHAGLVTRKFKTLNLLTPTGFPYTVSTYGPEILAIRS
jgi:hypothetical protein